MGEFQPFPLETILAFIHQQEIVGLEGLTLQDMKNPQGRQVQSLYYFFLQEFGFSESLLCVPFDALDDMDHQEIYRDIIPILNLQAACNFIFERFGCLGFGIKDLLQPTAKRTQKYVSVMQNFYYFCEQQCENVDNIQERVQGMADQRQELEKKIDEFKSKINENKVKALEDKEEEEGLKRENTDLNEELQKDLLPQRQEINEQLTMTKNELAAIAVRVNDLKENVNKLQGERDRLQGSLDGAAVIQQLTAELQELSEELNAKEKRKRECRRNLELLERVKGEYANFLELAQQIAQEHQKTKELTVKIRDQMTAREGVKLHLDDHEAMIREHDLQINDLAQQMGKLKLQWGRRKRGKGEEIEGLKEELDVVKKNLGEEEVAVVEVLNRIHNTEVEIEKEEKVIYGEGVWVKAQYARLLESIEKFNTKLNDDFAKLDEARERIGEATSKASTATAKGPAAL